MASWLLLRFLQRGAAGNTERAITGSGESLGLRRRRAGRGAKRAGETVEKAEPAAKATGAVDLMEALRASVERARSPKVTGGKAAGPGVIAEKKPGAKKRIRSTPPTDGKGG